MSPTMKTLIFGQAGVPHALARNMPGAGPANLLIFKGLRPTAGQGPNQKGGGRGGGYGSGGCCGSCGCGGGCICCVNGACGACGAW